MSVVRTSLLLSSANSYAGLVLQIAGTVIIARILSPAEAGVFAVATIFAAVASTFRDFGVAEYLIQKKNVTEADLKASFAVNLGASWLVGVVLLALSPLAASFYREPGVAAVMQVQALNFIFIPFGAVTLAWFRREMDFTPIFRAALAANLAQFLSSVGLALAGFSYMALAWSSLVGVVVTVAVATWHRPKWFPRRPGLKGTREVLKFGKFASAVFVAGHLSRGAPELVLGRTAGMTEVGFYSRAAGVGDLFERAIGQVVSQVCLPYLARGVRSEGTVVPSLVQTTRLMTGVGWPFVLFLGLAAYPAIRLMYGPQWIAAVQVAQVLCAVIAIETVYRYANQALFSLGLAGVANRLQLTHLAIRLLGLSAAFTHGLTGAAFGLLAAAVASLFASHRFLKAHAGYRAWDVWSACRASLLLALLTAIPYGALMLAWPANESNFAWHFVAGGVVTTITWTLAARNLKHPIWHEVMQLLLSVAARVREPGRPPS